MSQSKRFPQQTRKPLPEMVTDEGQVRCRFDLFIVMAPGQVSTYPGNKTAWCHRGDRFAKEDPERMLANLIKFFIRNHPKWKLAELWDNTRAKKDPERMVLKYHNGVIEINRLLPHYQSMLTKVYLPEFLKRPGSED